MLEEPRFSKEGYDYFDKETGEWRLKEDAPEWAVKEFKKFNKLISAHPDDNGIVTQY